MPGIIMLTQKIIVFMGSLKDRVFDSPFMDSRMALLELLLCRIGGKEK